MSGNQVICIAVDDHQRLVREHRRYRRFARFNEVAALTLALLILGFSLSTRHQNVRMQSCHRDVQDLRVAYERASVAAAALARSHEEVLDAKEQINDVGDKSWGRKFVVTKYTPRAGGINAFGDGTHTATRWPADPARHIVAVDPNLIPYGSWVWIEGLGWFQAQDCGEAIKGFRLDVMNSDLTEALAFGKQGRFAIVIPNGSAPVSPAAQNETPRSTPPSGSGNRPTEARSESPSISNVKLVTTPTQRLEEQPSTLHPSGTPRGKRTRVALMKHFQQEHAKNVERVRPSTAEQPSPLAHALSWIKNLASK